jgi:transcription elongation factor GreA
MPHEILLTKKGYEKLKAELAELKGPRREHVADMLRETRSHGDLRENAGYHEAKLNQGRLEGRIADLEKVLEYAKIVDRPEGSGEMAHLGSRVHLVDEAKGKRLTVTLVGSFEADPISNLISIASPLGEAVLGRLPGDEFEFKAPSGTLRYKVLSVETDPIQDDSAL